MPRSLGRGGLFELASFPTGGRGRSREQATTTTTAAGEPLAGLEFLVEHMECHQGDIGKFLFARARFPFSLRHCATAYPLQAYWRLQTLRSPSVNDNPAAPNIGTALLRCEAFFTRDILILPDRDCIRQFNS